ncbi:hypothetical protein PGT21_004482 [Puccinia graminis f. sp. tritici]|uniref:Uncharacterized protein n=1 Tax=Puccinia graminis f. sp. tritici TaxID=56615 RepID=A0A5B0REJ6_PUCGR|nr:hypothetical protein PGT21_004482 [Puccinia graminis f. sp. tritici]KAA1123325.1 hypothetical protein PGTUg99_007283 [Puccinia graminis f. sp. tritici]
MWIGYIFNMTMLVYKGLDLNLEVTSSTYRRRFNAKIQHDRDQAISKVIGKCRYIDTSMCFVARLKKTGEVGGQRE